MSESSFGESPPPPPPPSTPPSSPPPPPGGGAAPSPTPKQTLGAGGPLPNPKVDLGRWVEQAWELLSRDFVEILIFTVVWNVIMVLAYMACLLPGLFVSGPLMGSLYVFLGKKLVAEKGDLNDLRTGFSRFADTFLISILVLLIPAVVLGVLYIPQILAHLGLLGLAGLPGQASEAGAIAATGIGGFLGALSCLSCGLSIAVLIIFPILVGTFLVFAFPLVMFRGMSATSAIRASIAAVRQNFLGFLGLMAVSWVIMVLASGLGGLAGGVGAIVTSPLAVGFVACINLMAYRDFFGIDASHLEPYPTNTTAAGAPQTGP